MSMPTQTNNSTLKGYLLFSDSDVVHDDAVVQLGAGADGTVGANAALLDGDSLFVDHIISALAHDAELFLQYALETRPRSAMRVLVQNHVPIKKRAER